MLLSPLVLSLFNMVAFFWVFGILVALSLFVGIRSIISAFMYRASNNENALKIVTRAKLALIPFFVITTLLWALLFLASANPFLMWTWFTIIPAAILFNCGVFNIMSICSVITITNLKKQEIIKSPIHYVLQFVFILDVLDCVYLYIKKYKPHFGTRKRLLLTSLPAIIPVVTILIIGGAFYTNNQYKLNTEIAKYPLNYAVEQGDVKRVERVLKNGADPNEIHIRTGSSALLTACDKGSSQNKYEANDVKIIELLLEYGADPNYINFEDDRYYNLLSPLNVVLRNRHADYVLEIVTLLIEYDVDVNLEARGGTPLQVYCDGHSKPAEILKLLLENGADPNKHSDYHKGLKASTGYFEIIMQTPLIVFCNNYYADNLDVVRLLLEYGADVNHRDSNEKTALHYAMHGYGWHSFGNRLANLLEEHGAVK